MPALRSSVAIAAAPRWLVGELRVPSQPRGLVLLADGSAASRPTPRDLRLADALDASGFASLLLDLLAPEESQDHARVFDVMLQMRRLIAATDWTTRSAGLDALPIGYLAASIGSAAALGAAAVRRGRAGAVVCCGGRPDLATPWLPFVRCPTLMIVGAEDERALEHARRAIRLMTCRRELVVIDGPRA